MNKLGLSRQKLPAWSRAVLSHIHSSPAAHSLEADVSGNLLSIGKAAIQGDKETLQHNLSKRSAPISGDDLISVGEEYQQLEAKINDLIKLRKPLVVKIKRENLAKDSDEMKEAIALKGKLKKLEEQMSPVKKRFISMLSGLPNWTHPDTPVGDYSQCRVVHTHGSKPEFSFPIRNHLSIGEMHGIIDFESGRKVTGKDFYFLMGGAAALEMALCQYAMHKASDKGYCPVITPDIVQEEMILGMGYAPRSEALDLFRLKDHTYCLTATAEIPLMGMFSSYQLSSKELPTRMVAFGRCFRPETGNAGQVNRGLYRVHQFSKVELFSLTRAESGQESEETLQEMVLLQREIVEDLGLHYRLLEMSTEELGASAFHKYDLEVWMPGRDSYGETCSASNCTDFQTRRLSVCYNSKNSTFYPHSVNATACAVPRLILAILETFQQEDGSVVVPEVLHPYLLPQFRFLKPLDAPSVRKFY